MKTRSHKQQLFNDRYGPWAVVTGASSGIGRELAFRIAEAGLNLVLIARSQPAMDQMASELAAKCGVECRVIALDLSTDTGVDSLVAATRELEVGLLVAAARRGVAGLAVVPVTRAMDWEERN